MLKVNQFSIKGSKLEAIALPKEFEVKESLALLAQAIYVYHDRSHFGFAKVKTRAEVNRTKKKLYKQKGTGGARHGAKSAPIFVGGGVAHGPKMESRVLTLPQKMRQRALKIALGLKIKEDKILAISGLSELKKTKEVGDLIKKLNLAKVTFVLTDTKNIKAFRNIKNSEIVTFKDLNAYHVFKGGTLLLDADLIKPAAKAKTVKKTKKA